MSQPQRIDIVSRRGLGLTRDRRLLASIASQNGFDIHEYVLRRRYWDSRLSLWGRMALRRCLGRSPLAVTLFLEHLIPSWFSQARRNWFMPNQEWMTPETLAALEQVDLVLCKSHYAETLFAQRGLNTVYTSFTSEDRYRSHFSRNYQEFFHIAGRSVQKGTHILLTLWSQHPEWPRLTVLHHGSSASPRLTAANIHLLDSFQSDAELLALQNQHGIHLCPSLAEGFGHTINEAMSCAAVVVTTDAPPMNELVNDERGMVFAYERSEAQGIGERFYPDTEALAASIDRLLGMDERHKRQLGEAARAWYFDNDRHFRQQFAALIQAL